MTVFARVLTSTQATVQSNLIYKHNDGRLNIIGRERANRALIGCDNQRKRVNFPGSQPEGLEYNTFHPISQSECSHATR